VGYWDQVAVHEARGHSRGVSMLAARYVLDERRDPSHFPWDELLHPRTRTGEFEFKGSTERDMPAMTAKQLHKMLKKAGFSRVGQKGSHAIFKHPAGGRLVVVPTHSGSIPRGTLRHIIATAQTPALA